MAALSQGPHPPPAQHQSARHVIHRALCPTLALLASPDVHQSLLAPNHFDDFAQLLRPFEDSVGPVNVRTSQLEVRQCASFPLRFDSLDAFDRSGAPSGQSDSAPQKDLAPLDEKLHPSTSSLTKPTLSRARSFSPRPEVVLDRISAHVSTHSQRWSQTSTLLDLEDLQGLEAGNASAIREARRRLQKVRASDPELVAPWFAEMRQMVLGERQCVDHESFGWPVASLLVVSSTSPDPMNAFAALFEAAQARNHSAYRSRPYMDPEVLFYYVLVHDTDKSGTDLSESIAMLEKVKQTYGVHCCLLPLNSRSASAARSPKLSEIWTKALTDEPQVELLGAKMPSHVEQVPPPPPPKDGEEMMSEDKEEEDHAVVAQEEDGPYAKLFNDEDVQRLRSFVRELAAQSLIPWMERCVQQWNEKVTAARKGLAGLLLGAGRNLFGSVGRGSSSSSSPTPTFATLGYYPPTSIEAQTRRLADFAFAICDYRLAASMYDLGRKDAANDKAVKQLAGANEMFGLCHLMMMLTSKPAAGPIDVDSYLAVACSNYHRSPRRRGSALQIDSLRATLLYYEAYRAMNYFRSAPIALARLADEGGGQGSEGDLEIVAAMLLQQAADADLRQPTGANVRKCALRLVSAAHRYQSCGQKFLSLKAFRQAAGLYAIGRHLGRLTRPEEGGEGSLDDANQDGGEEQRVALRDLQKVPEGEWTAIGDHVNRELGRQAFAEGKAREALHHLVKLLRPSGGSEAASDPFSANGFKEDAPSEQEPHLQRHVEEDRLLDEFLTAWKYLDEEEAQVVRREETLRLPRPLFDASRCVVRTATSWGEAADAKWHALEEDLNNRLKGRMRLAKLGEDHVTATQETFWVDLWIVNPLGTALSVSDVGVDMVDAEEGKALEDGMCQVQRVERVQLEPKEEKKISIAVVAKGPSRLRCAKVHYLLAGQVPLAEALVKRGPRLNATKEQRSAPVASYAPDRTLVVEVKEGQPALDVRLADDAPERMGLGEQVEVEIRLRNRGGVAIRDASILVEPATLVALGSAAQDDAEGGSQNAEQEAQLDNSILDAEPIHIELPSGGELAPDAEHSFKMSLRGVALGTLASRWLFVFRSVAGEVHRFRLRHTFTVEPVLDLAVTARPNGGEALTYGIGLQAVNLCRMSQSIVIEGLTILSPGWRVKTSSAEEGWCDIAQGQQHSAVIEVEEARQAKSGAVISEQDRFLASQFLALLKGQKLNPDTKPKPIQLSRTQAVLDGTSSSSSSSSSSSVITSSSLEYYRASRLEWRRSVLAQQFPTIPLRDRLRLFCLFEPNDVDLVAHWRIPGTERRGKAFVFGLQLGPSHDRLGAALGEATNVRSLYEQTANERAALLDSVLKSRMCTEENPILVDLTLAQTWQHDFSKGPLQLPVTFTMRNLSTVRAVSFVLQLQNLPGGGGGAESHGITAPWTGRLTIRGTLPPRQTSRHVAKISIHAIGQWELGAWSMRCSTLREEGEEGVDKEEGEEEGTTKRKWTRPVAEFYIEQLRSHKSVDVTSTSSSSS